MYSGTMKETDMTDQPREPVRIEAEPLPPSVGVSVDREALALAIYEACRGGAAMIPWKDAGFITQAVCFTCADAAVAFFDVAAQRAAPAAQPQNVGVPVEACEKMRQFAEGIIRYSSNPDDIKAAKDFLSAVEAARRGTIAGDTADDAYANINKMLDAVEAPDMSGNRVATSRIEWLAEERDEAKQQLNTLAKEVERLSGELAAAAPLVAKAAELRDECDRLKQRLLTAAGDDLCRLTQEEINSLTSGEVPIPPKEEFLASCERFHARISKEVGVNNNCLTLAQLVAENERLKGELAERIDPRAIYDVIQCPACSGRKTISVFNPQSLQDEERRCDFCDGIGNTSLAEIVAKHDVRCGHRASLEQQLSVERQKREEAEANCAAMRQGIIQNAVPEYESCLCRTCRRIRESLATDAGKALVAELADKDSKIQALEHAVSDLQGSDVHKLKGLVNVLSSKLAQYTGKTCPDEVKGAEDVLADLSATQAKLSEAERELASTKDYLEERHGHYYRSRAYCEKQAESIKRIGQLLGIERRQKAMLSAECLSLGAKLAEAEKRPQHGQLANLESILRFECKIFGAANHGELPGKVRELFAERDSLRNRVSSLQAVLRKVEWVNAEPDHSWCEACENAKTEGHATDCELAAALSPDGGKQAPAPAEPSEVEKLPPVPSDAGVCDHYHAVALKAVQEWDGQNTADLFTAILGATGERSPSLPVPASMEADLEAVDKLAYSLEGDYGGRDGAYYVRCHPGQAEAFFTAWPRLRAALTRPQVKLPEREELAKAIYEECTHEVIPWSEAGFIRQAICRTAASVSNRITAESLGRQGVGVEGKCDAS